MKMLRTTTAALAASALGMAALATGATAQQAQDSAGVDKQNQQRIFNKQASGTGTALYVSPANVRLIQQKLNAAGYAVGNVDGQWGQATQQALQNWQQAQGLEPTGNLNMVTLQARGIPNMGQQQAMGGGQGAQGSSQGIGSGNQGANQGANQGSGQGMGGSD